MAYYLLSGEDSLAKDQKIEDIKSKVLLTKEAKEFDCEILYSHKLNAEVLKKSLIAIPAVASQRVVVIHNIQKLNQHNQDIILKYLEANYSHLVLILSNDSAEAKNNFIKQLTPLVKVLRFSKGKKKKVFDLTDEMFKNNGTKALEVLHDLIDEGNHPLQLMGGLIWYWGKEKSKLSAESFEKGLQRMQEADLNIKRNRLKPSEAMEVLVIQLMERN